MPIFFHQKVEGGIMTKILALATMEKLLKKGDSNLRISDPAKEELKILLEEHGEKLAKAAAKFAVHAGRKTIKAEDVILAAKSRLE
jgi:histone H3/H4